MTRGHRILHFALSFFPVFGGVTARIFNLMHEDGNHHTLCVPKSPSRYIPSDLDVSRKSDRYGNIHVRRVYLKERCIINLSVLDYVGERLNIGLKASRLGMAAGPCRYDFVYGHGPLEFAIASGKYAEIHRLPFVYEVHGLVNDNLWLPPHGWKGSYHRALQKLFTREERKILLAANAVVCQTESMKQRLEDLYGIHTSKVMVVPNGVDAVRFDPAKWRGRGLELRKEHRWEGKTVFMYSGLFDHINGIDQLLGQLRRIPPNLHHRLCFVLMGRGGLQDRVLEASKKYSFVQYLGMVDYEEIPGYMSACDVFVIPRPSSLPAETLVPMKLLEAMAMGKTVLVSDVGGMAEVVEDERNGLLYRKGHPKEFMERVIRLTKEGSLPVLLGVEARKKVIDRYPWDKSKKTLQGLYGRISGLCLKH